MKALLSALILCTIAPQTLAFSWHDLWSTKNKQAKVLMDAGHFAKAQETFDDPAWKAVAAFRAGNYKMAASLNEALKDQPDAYYNQGNALAHMGRLDAAIKAYDKALAINPKHQDALYNRNIIKNLLKEKNNQDKKNQDQQNKSNQKKQQQNRQKQDKQEQDKQKQDKQEQDKQEQDKQEQDKQEQDKQEQDKQEQDKQEQNKQEQDKQKQDKKSGSQAQEKNEQQQAKEQWLRLIPDDPGGLMREKFLRDYLRRQQER